MKRFSGFTLIEVLIALAIVSIALTAIIRTTSQHIKDTTYLENKMLAHWVGINIINAIRAKLILPPDAPDTLEQETEMLGKTFTSQASFSPSANPHIKEIHVSVSQQPSSQQSVELTSYLYVTS